MFKDSNENRLPPLTDC